MGKKPEYCEKCGSKLIETSRRSMFDAETGNPVFEGRVRCPKSLSFWIDLGHTHAKTSCYGGDSWYTPSEAY